MIPNQNPTIYIGDLRIDEPVTTLTDFIFVGVCFYAFFKTKNISNDIGLTLYRWFFLLTGASTLFAAIIGHAFLYHFGVESKIYGWVFGIISISFSQFAALYHTRQTIGESVFKSLFLFCILETITAFILVFVFWTFIVVEVHTAICLLLMVTILESRHYKKTKSALSINMIYGVVSLIIALLCHVSKLAPSVWFNHIDVSHIFMTASMYFMYRGAASFRPREEMEHV